MFAATCLGVNLRGRFCVSYVNSQTMWQEEVLKLFSIHKLASFNGTAASARVMQKDTAYLKKAAPKKCHIFFVPFFIF